MKLKLCSLLYLVFALLMLSSEQNSSFAQARLVIGNTSPVFMNIKGGSYLVVGDATTSAVTNTIMYTDAAARVSWIISEGDGTTNNRVKWYIGNAVAGSIYIVPFGRRPPNQYIPLTLTIGAAGTAGGSFVFSTYRTTDCINSSNLPTTGTFPPINYNSSAIPGDASNYGVDRFWEIDATSYGATKPDLSSLIFTYIDGALAEVAGVICANTGITEANLQAQRWNFNASPAGWQGDIFLKGTNTPASNIVTLSGAAVVSGASDLLNSRWWTLIDNTYPLPVTWLDFSAECNRGDITIKWSTASEQNSDFFTVEQSLNGINFTAITNVLAAGNSNTVKNYSAVDADPYSGTSFYRVRETDFNGKYMTTDQMIVNGCSNDNIFIYGSEGGVSINIDAITEEKYNFEIYDVLGQKLMNETKTIYAGSNHLKLAVGNIASGIYVVKIYPVGNPSTRGYGVYSSNGVTKKVFIRLQQNLY